MSHVHQLSRVPHPADFKRLGHCQGWVACFSWRDARNASVTPITMPSLEVFGSTLSIAAGRPTHAGTFQPNILEGRLDASPLVFVEKQVVLVTVPRAMLTGGAGDEVVAFTHCEVYPPTPPMTTVRVLRMLMNPVT